MKKEILAHCFKLIGFCLLFFTTISVLSHLSQDRRIEIIWTKYFILVSCLCLVYLYLQTFFKIMNLGSFKYLTKVYSVILFFSILIISYLTLFAYHFKALYLLDNSSFAIPKDGAVMGLIDWFYFSAVTFATVGYGDIYPLSTEARILVTVETLASIFILILVTANLIKFKELFSSKK